MGRTIGKSSIEVMRKRFPDKAFEIETYADAFDVLAEEVNKGGGGGEPITVDAALSDSSENPVQNNVVKAAIDAVNNVIRVPFTLTIDEHDQISGTTTANFADTLAAKMAGKTVIAEATLTVGVATQVFSGLMSGVTIDGQSSDNGLYATFVGTPSASATKISFPQLVWTANGVSLAEYEVALVQS